MTGICECCGRPGEVYVTSSACGALSLAYCLDCLKAGAEPWDELVLYISCAGRYPDDINEDYREIVRCTCQRLDRTEEEFAEAVKKAIEEDM